MRLLFILCCLFCHNAFQAQALPSSAGVYVLQGEMETASTLALDSNGRFQFFFSYGALDREGGGKWQRVADTIFLTSEPTPAAGFQLTASKTISGGKLTLQVTNAPPELLPQVEAIAKTKGKEYPAIANKEGLIVFPVVGADSVVLVFRWCPDRATGFSLAGAKHNHFSFRLLPSITEVSFEKTPMLITPEGMKGALPFSGDHVCHYEQEKREGETP